MPFKRHSSLYVMLGRRLQAAREAAGLTQEEVADKLSYSSHHIILNMEKGRRRIDVYELLELVRLYDVPIEEILADPDPEEQARIDRVAKEKERLRQRHSLE